MIEHADKLNNHAIQLASDGDYISAIACFKRAIILDQQNYLLWYNLGVTYRDAGELENARDALNSALKINKTNVDVIEALATTCLQLARRGEAETVVKKGLDNDDFNPRLWNLLGVVNFQKEKYEDACQCFEDAVTLDPYYKDALYNLRDCYDQLNNKTGVAECESKIKELK